MVVSTVQWNLFIPYSYTPLGQPKVSWLKGVPYFGHIVLYSLNFYVAVTADEGRCPRSKFRRVLSEMRFLLGFYWAGMASPISLKCHFQSPEHHLLRPLQHISWSVWSSPVTMHCYTWLTTRLTWICPSVTEFVSTVNLSFLFVLRTTALSLPISVTWFNSYHPKKSYYLRYYPLARLD